MPTCLQVSFPSVYISDCFTLTSDDYFLLRSYKYLLPYFSTCVLFVAQKNDICLLFYFRLLLCSLLRCDVLNYCVYQRIAVICTASTFVPLREVKAVKNE